MTAQYYDSQTGTWTACDSCSGPGLFLLSPEQALSCNNFGSWLRQSEDQRLYCAGEEISLRLPVAMLEEDARFGTVARITTLTLHHEHPDHLVLLGEETLLSMLKQDWLSTLQQSQGSDYLQRVLLNSIYSHERVARVLVDRLQELRLTLKTAMGNRELREIVVLNRDLGELVIALRETGLILRDALRATPGEAPAYAVLEIALREQRRMEDVVNLVYERYLTVTNAYNGIIQNNAHTVMKVMTVWLALLMMPIAFIMPFHMMTILPLEHWHYLWFGLLAYVFGATLLFAVWARKHGFFAM
ncbi:CorA family divalent cation transporter [Acidithiobacillus montserratensis]|uniref:CorA family divalent cation transporter n=1 Tax=Acidithiobacillus montserratensis TaxID=2729135 RepID=A0ACD5HI90_9PROT|nr:CorA family divalent cation transporter [Acidithiobacillus montserratensis]MBN2680282.1 magnesium transporter CorA family protein [Acidithiobacillaceae bacterium]MBU2748901.1 magnesium transporter CorA family protein [Acidithiobacillus montserratensis]